MSHGVYHLSPDVNNLSQLSVVIMPAMATRVGGIIPSVGLAVDAAGNLSTVPATATVMGAVKVGTGLSVAGDGTISVPASGNQTANRIYAGPASGAAGAPTFRTLVQADLPAGIAAQVQSDWKATSGLGQILNQPPITYTSPTITCTGNVTATGQLSTVGAAGLVVYSPDQSRFAQFNCANGANPIITSNSGVLNFGGSVAQLVNGSNSIGFQSGGTTAASATYIRASAGAPIYCDQNDLVVSGNHNLGTYGGTLYIYSPDLKSWGTFACANGTNPTISSNTSWLVVNSPLYVNAAATVVGAISTASLSTTGRVTAGTDVLISASASGAAGSYMQICNNGQFTDTNPWMYSSTGWIICQSNLGFKNGAGWAVYGPSTSGTSYMSTGWNGANPSLTSSTGVLNVVGGFGIVNGGLTVSGSGAVANIYGNVGINSGNTLYIYNSANTQSMTQGFGGGANPAINSSTGTLLCNSTFCPANISCTNNGSLIDVSGASSQHRALNNAIFVFYNAGNAQYGISSWDAAGNPGWASTTGTVGINGACLVSGNLTVNPTAAATGVRINLPNATDANIAYGMAAQGGVGLVLGTSNTINNGYKAYISAATQINVNTGVLYCTGSVSATAHTTHASGKHITDIHRAFHRKQEEANEHGRITEHVLEVGSWTLAPADDGMHLLCKRADDHIVEHVIPWKQFTDVTIGD